MKDDTSTPTPEDASPNQFERGMSQTPARDRAEAAIENLRRTGGVFVEAVRATRMAMVVTDPTLPGDPIVFANQSFLRMSGYRMEEVLGQQPHFMNGPGTDPKDAARFVEALRHDQDDLVETVQYRKDGSRFVATVLLSAFKDENGRTRHHFLSWLDVTRRVEAENELAEFRRAQTQLRKAEEKYRTLFETMRQGFIELEVVHDEDGRPVDLRYVELNPAFERQFGVPLSHARGRLASEFFPDFDPVWTEMFDRVARTGQPERIEHMLVEDRWFEVVAYPGADGCVMALYEDITARKEAEITLRESEERQAFLLKLSDLLRPLTDPAKVKVAAMKFLAEEYDVMRAGYYDAQADGDTMTVAAKFERDAVSAPEVLRLSDFGADIAEKFRAGQTLAIRDAETDTVTEAEREAHRAIGVRSWIIAPQVKDGKLLAIVGVVSKDPRDWTEVQIRLIGDVAERTWEAVERARAETELRDSEDRRTFVLELSDAMRPLTEADEIEHVAVCMLGQKFGASRVFYATIDEGGETWSVRRDYADGVESGAGRFPLSDFQRKRLPQWRAGIISSVADSETDTGLSDGDREAYAVTGTRAAIGVPVVKSNRFAALLVVNQTTPRHWSDAEIALAKEAAERTWAEIERTRAEAALRQSEERQAFLLRLSDELRPLADATAIQHAASCLLVEHMKVLRAGFGELDGSEFVVRADYSRTATSVEGRYSVDAFGPTLAKIYREGGTVVVRDANTDANISDEERATYASLRVVSHVTVAICSSGQPVISLGVQSDRPRDWSEAEIALVKDVAERTWAAVARARTQEALRESEAALADELAHAMVLRDLAIKLVTEESLPAIYGEILDAAITITEADTGTVQIYDPEKKALVLLVTRGIERSVADHVESVDASSSTACGIALRTGQRAFVDFDTDNKHLVDEACRLHVEAGLRSAQATPLLSRSGEPLGMLNTHWAKSQHRPTDRQLRSLDLLARQAADLIERRRAEINLRDSERHATILLAELQHRVRNTLGVVRSIARRTAENSNSVEGMLGHFQGRLDAFSRVQAALTRSPGAVVDLASLIEDEMVAHAAREGQQVSIKGPDLNLDPRTAERLSLAIHELTTNAVKHGAFVTPDGKVTIRWTREAGESGDILALDWTESGVTIDPEELREDGFGMELLQRSLPYDLRAETSVEFRSHGLHFELRMPLEPARTYN